MKVSFLLLAGLGRAQVEEAIKDAPTYTKSTIKAPFLEQFESLKNWFPSASKKQDENEKDLDLLQYRGLWEIELPIEKLILDDTGLVLKTLAAHSAICSKFETPIDPKGKDLVIQYEVKTQSGHDCGGAYLKLLTYKKDFKPETFNDKTEYTIMFGPDKCGSSNKVHFIFRHQSPKTKEYEEKHLVSPPQMVSDKRTNLYTLVVNKDQTFHIKINNNVVKSGSLLKDFEPAVNPPKEIDDEKDIKPSNWVDEKKIIDPSAKKPDDWDESQPKEIVDESKSVPDDWLENEPAYVPDPEVTKPEDWDDEEDGEWTAPSVPNPKCAGISGCGKWTPPIIPNPKYKGKWTAPMIDNPAYKGEWAPRKIANPNYFEDLTPANFNKIGAVGFELWSMNSDIMFDNIYIGHSEKDAEKLALETWKIKYDLEKALEPAAEEAKVEKGNGFVDQLKELYEKFLVDFMIFVDAVKADPIKAFAEHPQYLALLTLLLALPSAWYAFATAAPSSDPKAAHNQSKKQSTAKTEVKPKNDVNVSEEDEKPKKRATKKD